MSGDRQDSAATPQLPLGAQVGSYQILSLLGRGGMGEVYRARDTKLGREVAIKVIASSLVDHPDRLERFTREAQLLAALNHPHIGAIHAVEELGGHPALVLELVEGPTLADRLNLGPLPVPEALTIARQIADALDAAHEKGIIHRDLKPANIKIRPDGNVKVLDFGLAKGMSSDSSSPLADSPTMLSGKTLEGVILGTAPYMSPEQARGHRLDKRTDVWSFGCVLYEMLTGAPPFSGETLSDTIAAILGREADWTALPPATPGTIRVLLRRLLEKDRRRRLHDIADARLEIDDAIAGRDDVARDALQTHGVSRWLPWAVAAIAVAGAAAWTLLHSSTQPASTATRNIQVRRLTDLVGLEQMPAISPDGKTVAFVATQGPTRQIWVRLLSGGAPLAITKDAVDHYGPRWSADSGSLLYFTQGAQAGDPGTIWEVPALGGATRRLVSAVGPGDLSHDGTKLAFLRFNEGAVELAVANRDGSNARPVAKLPSSQYFQLKWSFDDRRIALVNDPGGARFASETFVIDVASGHVTHMQLEALAQGLSWLRDGSGLIVSSAQGSTMAYPPTFNLWVLPLDGGTPSQLTFGESSYEFPDLGPQGDVVASRTRTNSDVWKFPVNGPPSENVRRGVRITRQTGLIQTVTVSPDESEVAFLSDNGGHSNVWTARVATGEMRPLTREFDPRFIIAVPVWSPTGEWISFLSNRKTGTDVTMWLSRPDGSDARDLGVNGFWVCWPPDGKNLYYTAMEKETYVIEKRPVDGGPPTRVRDDNAMGCQVGADGTLYYAKPLIHARGSWDLEIRRAKPENGSSDVIGRLIGSRVPASAVNFHALLSPDGRWLAMPLLDGSTTNLWAISTTDGQWRQLTDFADRDVLIARRIAWSNDSGSIYASVSDIDSDIVMLAGLR